MEIAQACVARVAVPGPLRTLFDYRAEHRLAAGIRVRVELGKRIVVGVVMECIDESAHTGDLKSVIDVLDTSPVLDSALLKLIRRVSDYYLHPLGDTAAHALPVALRRGEPPRVAREAAWKRTALAPEDPEAAPGARQRDALRLLAAHPRGLGAGELAREGISSKTLERLRARGWIEPGAPRPARPRVALADTEAHPGFRDGSLTLTDEQRAAVESIAASLSSFQCHLLEGITGSGKTEVYLRLIRQVLDTGRQVLVLVPEIGLTPQTVSRFRERFGDAVGVSHSGLTDLQRLTEWTACARKERRVLIGTRSAVFTPMPELALIVVDEEHDTSFKQEDGLRYSARDVAIMRAQATECPVILGSATPALESLNNALRGRYRHHRMLRRATGNPPPTIRLLDIRGRDLDEGLCDELIALIRRHLERGHQVLVFLNRRGFAPVLMCHQCGWTASCSRCDARFTLHREPPALICHHCDTRRGIPGTCPECAHPELDALGLGTQRTEQTLARLFPTHPVIRVDRDTMRSRHRLDSTLAVVRSEAPMILLGTQMLAKGHHFPGVTLVTVINADAGLFSADFRGPERMAQIVLQVAGRAGRANRTGEVVLQTHHPDHPTVAALATGDYHAFALGALTERRQARLPPYAHMAMLRAEAQDLGRPLEFLHQLKHGMSVPAGLEVVGPLPSPMQRKAGRHRCQMVLLSSRRSMLRHALEHLRDAAQSHPSRRRVRWSIDVDPLDTF
ncbi:MAG: primosomal protein N' [Gammaproteobacteria bacterium]